MKKRTRVLAVCAVVLTLAVAGIAWQRDNILVAYWVRCVHKVTDSLPHCDRVDVFLLNGKIDRDATTEFPIRPYDAFSTVVNQKTFGDIDAEALAVHWREQVFAQDYSSLCHYPAYGLRFYRGASLTFETSLCFECSNFYVTASGRSGWWGFDKASPKAARLLERLQHIFPESVPGSNTE